MGVEVHYSIHKIPPLDSILSCLHPANTLTSHFFINRVDIIILSTQKPHEDTIQATDSEFPIVESVRSAERTRENKNSGK
jgi:hypothetical protein